MKNTTTTKQATTRKQAKNLATLAKEAEAMAQAETIQADENPATDETITEAITEENPSLEDERAARLAYVADQVATYDGKPLSVQLAEWKFAFDMAKNQAGKYKNKTGESELSAKEFMQALLLQATIDGIHPREDFLDHCHFVANKRDLTSEKTLVKKVETAVESRLITLRRQIIKAGIEFNDSIARINKQLEMTDLEPTTQEEMEKIKSSL